MIKIVTDSTASLTFDEYRKYGIAMVPLYINQGERSRKELVDISYEEFYKLQRAGVKFTTSQPTPNDFLEVFRPVIEAGDEIICVLLSSQISGSINAANLAKENLKTDRISIFDSRHSAFGQGYMAIKAKELADSGMKRELIVESLAKLANQTFTFFIVESLRYLYEGGRLSGAEALLGSLIQIKPIIWFDKEGKLSALEKVRTLKAAKAKMLEMIRERMQNGIEKIALHYADNYEEATDFAKSLSEISGLPVPLVKASPVLGAHIGPDVLGPSIVTK